MKNLTTLPYRIGCLAFLLFLAGGSFPLLADDASPAKFVAGSKLDALTVGAATYHNVLIRSISARSAMITHDGGMKSILLRDLTPELQQRFNYNPEADRAQEAIAKAGQAAAEKHQQARIEAAKNNLRAQHAQSDSKIDQLLSNFGQPPEIKADVDLRPRFTELGLWVKSQGFRPSCSVFAIVSALEFQSAELNGTPVRYSEEYLLWATRKSLKRFSTQAAIADDTVDDPRQKDAGFALEEVVTALRTYGIPNQEAFPYRFTRTDQDPPAEIVEQARNTRHVAVHRMPGRDGAALVANLIHALNAGIPVPIGLKWAKFGQNWWRSGYLNEQPAFEDGGHAVTVVGYKSKSGNIEDTVFTFKNSWGPEWGANGYGYATYKYLSKNLHTAVVLEVLPKKN